MSNTKITNKQRGSIHIYFEELSRELMESGVDFNVMLRDVRVTPTPKILKDVYREMGRIKFGVESTWCVHIPFPSYMDSDEYLNSYVQNS